MSLRSEFLTYILYHYCEKSSSCIEITLQKHSQLNKRVKTAHKSYFAEPWGAPILSLKTCNFCHFMRYVKREEWTHCTKDLTVTPLYSLQVIWVFCCDLACSLKTYIDLICLFAFSAHWLWLLITEVRTSITTAAVENSYAFQLWQELIFKLSLRMYSYTPGVLLCYLMREVV